MPVDSKATRVEGQITARVSVACSPCLLSWMRWECKTASCPAHSETPSVRLQRLSQTSSCQHASSGACKQAQAEPELVNSKQSAQQHKFVYAYTTMHNDFRGLKTRSRMIAPVHSPGLTVACQLADRVVHPCGVWESTGYL